MAHSVRRIIIIIRRTFTFTVSKITVILYLEEIGGAVEMKLLSIPVGVSDFAEIRRNGTMNLIHRCRIYGGFEQRAW